MDEFLLFIYDLWHAVHVADERVKNPPGDAVNDLLCVTGDCAWFRERFDACVKYDLLLDVKPHAMVKTVLLCHRCYRRRELRLALESRVTAEMYARDQAELP